MQCAAGELAEKKVLFEGKWGCAICRVLVSTPRWWELDADRGDGERLDGALLEKDEEAEAEQSLASICATQQNKQRA